MKQCRGKENWRKEGEGMQRLVHFCRTGRTGGGGSGSSTFIHKLS